MMNPKLTPDRLRRRAVVYVRQTAGRDTRVLPPASLPPAFLLAVSEEKEEPLERYATPARRFPAVLEM